MIILEDMGQKEEKHTVKNQWFYENGIDVVRVPLPVGDYVIANDKAINVLERKEQRNIKPKNGLLGYIFYGCGHEREHR